MEKVTDQIAGNSGSKHGYPLLLVPHEAWKTLVNELPDQVLGQILYNKKTTWSTCTANQTR